MANKYSLLITLSIKKEKSRHMIITDVFKSLEIA